MNILLRGGKCVFSDRIRQKDILIAGEAISRVEDPDTVIDLPPGTLCFDMSGKYLLPGFIDAHTHYGLGEGEDATADDFFSGSKAAAVGGVTTFIDFADQLADKTLAESAGIRINEAKDSAVDFSLHQGIYRMHRNIADELYELRNSGITALKIFTTYKEFGVYLDPGEWNGLFGLCRDSRMLVCVHAEDETVLEAAAQRSADASPGPEMHPILRPAEAEASAIRKAGRVAKENNLPLYIVHVSSEMAMDAVRRLREDGAVIIAETAPHYLFLTEEKLKTADGALYLMTPPLRKTKDNDVLKAALKSGEIDIIATDHCSYPPGRKTRFPDCRKIPAGIPGSGEAASLLCSLFSDGAEGVNSTDFVSIARVFSEMPARVFGLYPKKGSLLPGTDADITVISPDAEGIISSETVNTLAGYTPYDGVRYRGAPSMIILRGEIIVENGIFCGKRGGGRFQACRESEVFQQGGP